VAPGCEGSDESDRGAVEECPAPEIEGCTSDALRGDLTCAIEHGGAERSYRVVVPEDGTCAPRALVFDLHGLTSNPVQQDWITGIDELARARGFVSVRPAGSGAVASWNAGTCCGQAAQQGVDDVGFLDAVRARVAAAVEIDRRRVYATGLSNGAYLSHRLACERADVYAAVAPVAGVLGLTECASSRPVPVLQIHGTEDPLVPYDGGGLGGGPSARATAAFWAARNACDQVPEVTFEEGEARCERWSDCAGGADVELCTIGGGGHSWPGGPDLVLPMLGETSQDLDATRRILDFFEAHAMSEAPPMDWSPGEVAVPPHVPDPNGCDVSMVAESPIREVHLVMPGEGERPTTIGTGDVSGTWTLRAAELYLPPIATTQVDVGASRIETSGAATLTADGAYALRVEVSGEIATSSYGTLHLARVLQATGARTPDGTLTPTCGPREQTELVRVDETSARLSWLVSSGLIGEIWMVAELQGHDPGG
jgi:polyhydroxybutyrate depolymerase